MIAGRQRVRLLRQMFGEDLIVKDGGIETRVGTFPVRVVDWPEDMAKAANLAANNPKLQGQFTETVADLIRELELERPDLWDELLLGEIALLVAEEGGEDGESVQAGNPEIELQPYEHYDYLLVVARTVHDWEFICEALKVAKVNASAVAGKKKIGLGRVVSAERLIEALKGKD